MSSKVWGIEEAKKRRECDSCGTPILKGSKCLTFRKGTGQYQVTGNLCVGCVKKVHETLGQVKTIGEGVYVSIKKLLDYSMEPINWDYSRLTGVEKGLISKEEYESLSMEMEIGRFSPV
jgi:hypothetical protein